MPNRERTSLDSIPDTRPLLRMAGIDKHFPGVRALSSASFEIKTGEIHALVGENGAGKSTLIKILTGALQPDGGVIEFGGSETVFNSPRHAQQSGIATMYQENTLIPTLSARDNLFLGREKTVGPFLDRSHELSRATELFRQLGVEIEHERPSRELTIAQQQLVEIGRALVSNAKLIVMDEPTATLTPNEVTRLFSILRELTSNGIAIIFVSHRLEEVLSIADRITVLRDGSTIETRLTAQFDKQSLIELMVGRSLDQEYPTRGKRAVGDHTFEVRNLSGGNVRNASFSVQSGEIVGFAGLLGAGLTRVARMLFGADEKSNGEILLDGQSMTISSPSDAIDQGICLLTEDRKTQGLILRASVRENFSLPNLTSWSRFGWIEQHTEHARFQHRVEHLAVKISGPEQRAENLSGGNQQKLLIARWLEMNSRVIIFDEPTRGIDVGAKYEIYLLIQELAAQGKIILVMSSEITELLGICDKIYVMRRGSLAGEIKDIESASQETIMAMAV